METAHQVSQLCVRKEQDEEDECGTGQPAKCCGQSAQVHTEWSEVAHLASNL